MRHMHAGLLVASKALLEENPDPTEEEIRYWLAGNLCRCTVILVIEAVQDAAREMKEPDPWVEHHPPLRPKSREEKDLKIIGSNPTAR